jgi:hypothetical protein
MSRLALIDFFDPSCGSFAVFLRIESRVVMVPGLLLVLLILSGCTTSIKYEAWTPKTEVQSTALKFVLQDSTITLQAPNTPANPPLAGGAGATASKKACPDDVTAAEWSTTWWECFNQVAALASPAASDLTGGTPWVATPDDSSHLWLTTTAISGTAITGQDGLYSVVTVKFTSNVGTVITAAGTGAAGGFGFGGPYGATAGGLLGAISVVKQAEAVAHGVAAPPASYMDFVCPADKTNLDLSNAATTLQTPTISFPVTIKAADARPLAPKTELTTATQPAGPATVADCWHTLPNSTSPAMPRPLGMATGTSRAAVPGDGWLYRLVGSCPAAWCNRSGSILVSG